MNHSLTKMKVDMEYCYHSPLGPLSISASSEALTALRFVQQDFPRQDIDLSSATNNAIRRTIDWLDTYFAGNQPDDMPPLAPRGTPFQLCVWHELLTIPYGQTVTYGQLASRIGCGSARAVGQAVGHNPIAIIIPCHRVVASTGLGGYAYGTNFKDKLLSLEFFGRI